MDDIRRVAKQAQENRIEAILRERGSVPHAEPTIPNASPRPIVQAPAIRPNPQAPHNAPAYDESSRQMHFSYGRVVGLALLVCILTAGSFFGYRTYQVYEARKAAQGPAADDTIQKVGKLVELPPGETPTVATISDLKQLEGQPFFAGAQVGDKVVIYKEAKLAILYRPSTNKVIRDAPLGE